MGFGDLFKKASEKANELVRSGADMLDDVKQTAVRSIDSASEAIKERVETYEAEAEERRKQKELAEAERRQKQELVKRITGILKGRIQLEAEKERKKRIKANQEKLRREREEAERENARKAEIEKNKEKARADRIAKALEPSCEKGDCLWNNGRFYYICDECVECNRKISTKNMQGKVKYPQLWKYMKRYEQQEKLNEERREFEDRVAQFKERVTENGLSWYDVYYDVDRFLESLYDYSEDNPIRNYVNELHKTEEDLMERKDYIGELLIAGYMPKFIHYRSIADFINNNGIDNAYFDLVWDLKDVDIYIPDGLLQLLEDGEMEFSDEEFHPLELERDFYRNPSLYQRDADDFVYTIEHLLKAAKEDEDRYKKLFDEKGNILPAGIGGPQKGFYDPCIWNVIKGNI